MVFSYYSKPQEIVFIDSWGAQARITRQDITDWMGRDFEKYADTPESFKAHVTDKLNVDHAEWDALRNRIKDTLEERNLQQREEQASRENTMDKSCQIAAGLFRKIYQSSQLLETNKNAFV